MLIASQLNLDTSPLYTVDHSFHIVAETTRKNRRRDVQLHVISPLYKKTTHFLVTYLALYVVYIWGPFLSTVKINAKHFEEASMFFIYVLIILAC